LSKYSGASVEETMNSPMQNLIFFLLKNEKSKTKEESDPSRSSLQ
jgi:hypothetical protein